MLVLAFLCGLVVVGNNLQLAMCADFSGEFGQFNGFCGGIGAAARHDGNMTCGVFGSLFDRDANDFAMFFYVDGGRFAGGADHADAIGAFGDVPVDELAQAGVVHAAVFVHRSGQGHDAASNRCHNR